MLSITGLTLEQFADLMNGMGFRGEKGERPKVKPLPRGTRAIELLDGTRVMLSPFEPAAVAAPPVPKAAPTVAPDEAAATPPPVDALIKEATSAAALEAAPPATAFAEAGIAAIEAVEQGPTDVDQAPERPNGAAPVPDSAEPPAEMETFYTFRILPRGRNQRGGGPQRNRKPAGDAVRKDAPRKDGKQPAKDGPPPARKAHAEKPGGTGRPPRKDNKRGGPPKGRPPSQKPQRFESGPAANNKQIDPDSPFAILQKLKDGQ